MDGVRGFALGLLVLAAAPGASAEEKPKLASVSEFGACAERWGTDACLALLQAHVNEQPARAFEAGKAVTMSTAHWAAVPFFEQALAQKGDAARCKDERLESAVAS